jgi:prepilin-type N-terminal cleavage/methylation domain-containing protein
MKRGFTLTELLCVLAILVVVMILPVCWIVSSYFEAQSFNRLTKSNATTFDAMFTELRVQASPK